jgi:hypothetical protein
MCSLSPHLLHGSLSGLSAMHLAEICPSMWHLKHVTTFTTIFPVAMVSPVLTFVTAISAGIIAPGATTTVYCILHGATPNAFTSIGIIEISFILFWVGGPALLFRLSFPGAVSLAVLSFLFVFFSQRHSPPLNGPRF